MKAVCALSVYVVIVARTVTDALDDVALHKPATVSGGTNASLAVDGKIETCVVVYNADGMTSPWLSLDLSDLFMVHSLTMTNNVRFSDVNVTVSVGQSRGSLSRCGPTVPGRDTHRLVVLCEQQARFVHIQLEIQPSVYQVPICEVQITGTVVEAKPFLTVQPPGRLTVSVSDDLSGLTCSVRARPAAQVVWLYDGGSLPQGVSDDVTAYDGGGSLPQGVSDDVTVSDGGDSLPQAVSDDVTVSDDGDYLVTVSVLRWTGSRLDKIKAEGRYQCTATNRAGETTSGEAYLNPIAKPVLSTPLDTVYQVSTGGDLSVMTCTFTAKPSPVLYWTHNGGGLPVGVGHSSNTSEDTGLYVTTSRLDWAGDESVRREAGGAYRCHASNVAGTTSSGPASLSVLFAPMLSDDLDGTYNISVYDDLSVITCRVRARPAAEIVWSHNNRSLPLGVAAESTTEDLVTGMFTVSRLKWTHHKAERLQAGGVYRCNATNAAGHSTSRPTTLYPFNPDLPVTTILLSALTPVIVILLGLVLAVIIYFKYKHKAPVATPALPPASADPSPSTRPGRIRRSAVFGRVGSVYCSIRDSKLVANLGLYRPRLPSRDQTYNQAFEHTRIPDDRVSKRSQDVNDSNSDIAGAPRPVLPSGESVQSAGETKANSGTPHEYLVLVDDENSHHHKPGPPHEYLDLVDDGETTAGASAAGPTTHPYENTSVQEHSPSQRAETDITSEYMKTYHVDTTNVTSEYIQTYPVDTDNVTSEYLTTLTEDRVGRPLSDEPEYIEPLVHGHKEI